MAKKTKEEAQAELKELLGPGAVIKLIGQLLFIVVVIAVVAAALS